MKRILITGANRGIGFEFVRQLSQHNYQVLACYKDPEHCEDLKSFSKLNSNVQLLQLDINNDMSICGLAKELENQPLDWLIHNAGVQGEHGVTIGNIDRANFIHLMNVNCFGALKLSETLLPNLQKGRDKLIIAISSALSSISENQVGRSYAYRSSKAALNCAMRSFAQDSIQFDIKVMILNPGWVKTRIGGPKAPIDVQTSVRGMLNVIEKYKENSHAEVLRSFDDTTIPW